MTVLRKKSWGSRVDHTDCVAGLLGENLSQLDHLSIIVELLGEIDHLVSCILLFAWSWRGQEGRESSHGDGVAPLSASCGEL